MGKEDLDESMRFLPKFAHALESQFKHRRGLFDRFQDDHRAVSNGWRKFMVDARADSARQERR